MTMNMKFLVLLVLGGILLFGLNGCRRSTPPIIIQQLVKTTEVKQHTNLSEVIYPGRIQAAADVKLAFRVAGPVKHIYVKEGQYVKRGVVLAELDPRDYKLKYDAALAEYNQVKDESERIIELYRRNSVTVNDYDKAIAALKRVTALYDANRNMLGDTKLRAPFDGYIQNKYFDAYEIVNQGTPVLSMIDNDYLEVDIDIPSRDYIRREDFVRFDCRMDVYPDTILPLELLEVNQKANFNQLFKMRFRLKRDKNLKLAAGMSASVAIHFKASETDLSIIPIAALFQKNNRSYVWLYDQPHGVVKMMPVEVVQIQKDGEVLVRSGLQDGQRIISAGVNNLTEGQSVKELAPISPSNIGGLL